MDEELVHVESSEAYVVQVEQVRIVSCQVGLRWVRPRLDLRRALSYRALVGLGQPSQVKSGWTKVQPS